jgi:hypothetical protein
LFALEVADEECILWDVTLCGSCTNRHFGGPYRLHHQGDKNRQARNKAITGNRRTQPKIPEDGILHSDRYENQKSYIEVAYVQGEDTFITEWKGLLSIAVFSEKRSGALETFFSVQFFCYC